jgi:hypothetical protein
MSLEIRNILKDLVSNISMLEEDSLLGCRVVWWICTEVSEAPAFSSIRVDKCDMEVSG